MESDPDLTESAEPPPYKRVPRPSVGRGTLILLLIACPSLLVGQEAPPDLAPFHMELPGLYGVSFIQYNRVDGLALSYAFDLRHVEEGALPHLTGQVIWRTARSRFGWSLTVDQTIPGHETTSVGVDLYRQTSTNDGWRIGSYENSIGALLFHDDRRNYFEREGIRLWGEYRPTPTLSIGLEMTWEDLFDLQTTDPFALFGNRFRNNSPIQEDRLRALIGRLSFDTRDNVRFPRQGWFHTLEVERAGGFLGSGFNYWRGWLDLRRYQPVFFRNQLDVRVLLSAPLTFEPFDTPALPSHRFTLLGGLGGLRGFPDFAFQGDGLFVATAEYRHTLPPHPWINPFFFEYNLVLFLEAGSIHEPGRGYDNPAVDVGIGLGGLNVFSYLGIYLAQKLNRFEDFEDGPRLVIRLDREF